MTIKMIMFDLDGTLLPMDMEVFTGGYFKLLTKKMAPYGYEPEALIKATWHSTGAMVKNDGHCSNAEAFWKDFAEVYGEKVLEDKEVFEEYYANEFEGVREFCGFSPKAAEIVRWLQDRGVRVVLATNPLFPATATKARIRWAGLEPDEFEYFTTYENIGYCKPNPDYYREVLRNVGLDAENCVMVGNDVDEDMIAADLGMQVFLLTDCMINRSGKDIGQYPHGGFDELKAYLQTLIG